MNGTVILTSLRSGQHEVRVVAEDLDHREDVVPAAGVEPVGVLAERVDDLRHLEGRRQRLDQHRGADQAAREPERLAREGEDVVPERRLEVVLHLRQVEVQAPVALGEPLAGVEGVEAEVHERARDRLAVERQVLLRQMPAARADEQRGRVLDQFVVAAVGAVVGDRALDRVDQVQVALDLVAPGGGVGVLEVGHEALGAAVERVDDELAVGRAGDLRAPVLVVRPRRRDLPVAVADLLGLLQEAGRRAALGRAPAAARRGGRRSAPAARRRRPARRRTGSFRASRQGARRLGPSRLHSSEGHVEQGHRVIDRAGRGALAICSAQPGLAAAIASAPVARRLSALRAPSLPAASGCSRL